MPYYAIVYARIANEVSQNLPIKKKYFDLFYKRFFFKEIFFKEREDFVLNVF